MAITDADVTACYNMSLRDFEHSGVHDHFKVCKLSLSFFFVSSFSTRSLTKTLIQAMSKFIAASRQTTDLDKTRVLLERRIKEVKDESKQWTEVAAKANEGQRSCKIKLKS